MFLTHAPPNSSPRTYFFQNKTQDRQFCHDFGRLLKHMQPDCSIRSTKYIRDLNHPRTKFVFERTQTTPDKDLTREVLTVIQLFSMPSSLLFRLEKKEKKKEKREKKSWSSDCTRERCIRCVWIRPKINCALVTALAAVPAAHPAQVDKGSNSQPYPRHHHHTISTCRLRNP